MIQKSLNILTHPLFLSIVIGTIFIFLFPFSSSKYKIDTIEHKEINPEEVYSYIDLDNDGTSEKIWYHGSPYNYPSFIITVNGKTLDQWNFSGVFIDRDFFIYCDYDLDSIKEIFIFTIVNDSIYYELIRPYSNSIETQTKRYLDVTKPYNGEYKCEMIFCESNDIDRDGYKELIVEIITGIAKQPRNLYLIDINDDTILKSPESGSGIYNPLSADINNDGHIEYLGDSRALGNYENNDTINYPDTHAWLMVLDKNMSFLFPPVKFGEYKTDLDVRPLNVGDHFNLIALQKHRGMEDIKNVLYLFDENGVVIRKRELTNLKDIEKSMLFVKDDTNYGEVYIQFYNGTVSKIDTNLDITPVCILPGIMDEWPVVIDFDLDGEKEILFFGLDYEIFTIVRNDFSNPVVFDFENENPISNNISIIKRDQTTPLIYFQRGGHSYILNYHRNSMYYLKYLLYIGIYSILYALFYLIRRSQQIIARRKYQTEKKIAELQLQSVKSQLDPHFTLNILESIGSLYNKKDNEKASYVFGKYAKLLRTTIIGSDNIDTTLSEELDYVKHYLDLEKYRYEDKFVYEIQIEERLDCNIHIPKMLIHTFAENAIKHGIKHRKRKGGCISIRVKSIDNGCKIIVEDNGVGRVKSNQYSSFSTGKGLKILDNILNLYKDLKKVNIRYSFSDLESENKEPLGTKVSIFINN